MGVCGASIASLDRHYYINDNFRSKLGKYGQKKDYSVTKIANWVSVILDKLVGL